MVSLGFEPGVAGWWAQTKPWSYGGRYLKHSSFHFKFGENKKIGLLHN